MVFPRLTCNHECLSVSPKTVFEQPCENRVSVWHKQAVARATELVSQVSWKREQHKYVLGFETATCVLQEHESSSFTATVYNTIL